MDCDRADTAAVGGLLGGVGEKSIKMAKASLQYSCSHYSRDGLCKVPIAGQETRRTVRDGVTGVGAAGCYEVNGR